MSNERILQRVTRDFLQRGTFATQQVTSAASNQQILQQVTSDFLQRATFSTSNKRILQRVTSDFLQRVMSDFATSFFQRVTSNEWKVTPPKIEWKEQTLFKTWNYLVSERKEKQNFSKDVRKTIVPSFMFLYNSFEVKKIKI